MFLILCGDLREDPQESLPLKVIATSFGQVCRTKQRKALTFISHQVDHFDEPDVEFGEDNLNDSEEDDASPDSVLTEIRPSQRGEHFKAPC